MQTEKTRAGFEAGDLLAGIPLGLIVGVIAGLTSHNLIIGVAVGGVVGFGIMLSLMNQRTKGPNRKEAADGGGGGDTSGGSGGDWAHTASQRCFDSNHKSDSADWGGGDGDGGGGDGGGGGGD